MNNWIRKSALGLILILGMSQYGWMQHDHIQFRFANLKINDVEKSLSVDIEVFTRDIAQSLYASNLRFFFEADFIEFASFSDFKEGYGFITPPSQPIIGSMESAANMFDLKGKAGYHNIGIEILDQSKPDIWKPAQWERLVRVNYLLDSERPHEDFCPSFIWDKSLNKDKSGLLAGSRGATTTVFDNYSHGELLCGDTECVYHNFNWELENSAAPFGSHLSDVCVESSEDVTNLDSEDGFYVKQNTPNPYESITMIEFNIPWGEEVTLSIYDVSGVQVAQYIQKFSQGRHHFVVDDERLIPNTYLYTIKSGDFTSDYFKMIKIQ